MNKIATPLSGLFVLEPKIFSDSRGYFVETFNHRTFTELGFDYHFVQDNESFSQYGTLRGIHFQKGKMAQAKLIRVVDGEILDVAVDLRKDSPTFGKSFSRRLSSENKHLLLIPRRFAHGFSVLSATARVIYKCDNFYSPGDEAGIHFADKDLHIDWMIPKEKAVVSEKDQKLQSFQQMRDQL
jgi:dTDP-4-dehydrorhamnose 3,5-epimerase